jgi:DNA polymerase III sliding clamp (beta) subunit (PCNA family)
MKITVSSQDLKETIGIAQNTLGTNQDITSHFIFQSEKEGVSVMACSPPRQFSKIPVIGATVQEKGSFSIEGKRLASIVGVAKGVIEITYDEETKEVAIKTENGSGTNSSLDPSSFPPWVEKLAQATLLKEVSSSVLYDTLNANRVYVSQDESRRPELAMLLVEDGKSYACDGFMLGIARHDELKGMNLKIHFKDISPLQKFLKAYEGNTIEVLSGGQATFFKAEDGASFGIMDLPYTFPPITQQYADAFDWTPRRVWRLSKDSLIDGLTFLSAFADKTDYRVSFKDPEDEALLPPQISMSPSSGKGDLSYNLEVPVFEFDESTELSTITDLGELMYATRLREAGVGDDIPNFDFNYLSIKKAIEAQDNIIVMGCNREGNKGYMLFKSDYSSGVQTVSIIGWML